MLRLPNKRLTCGFPLQVVQDLRNLRASKTGVLIYWHVERRSVVVHSQVLDCSASEVAAMVHGAMHDGTAMDVKSNYVDTHGQSVVGFGLTRLLNFDLLPRIKRINHLTLYPATAADRPNLPCLAPALVKRGIDWDLIAEQYDDMTAPRGALLYSRLSREEFGGYSWV